VKSLFSFLFSLFQPVNLCEDCINQLQNNAEAGDGDEELVPNLPQPQKDSESLPSLSSVASLESEIRETESLGREVPLSQHESRVSPDSTLISDSESFGGDKPSQQTSQENEPTKESFENESSLEKNSLEGQFAKPSSFKRPLADKSRGASCKRFKSDELNALFSKPMPMPVRQQMLAKIKHIPKEDLRDKEVLKMWFANHQKNQQKERMDRVNRSHTSTSGSKSHRSNASISSNSSIASNNSVQNSMSQPLVMQSPQLTPRPPAPPPTSRTARAPLVDIPDNDSTYSFRSEDDNQPPPPFRNVPVPPPKRTNKTNQRVDDGNAHSNKAAPRRVNFQDPVIAGPSNTAAAAVPRAAPIAGHKNTGG
jgi:hypothetical protein